MFEEIAGQQYAVRYLKKAIEHNNIANSYLFFGPEGIGKYKTAVAFAKAVNCQETEGSCGGCRSCKKIEKFFHPDVISIEPDGDTIKINQIKEIQKRIAYRPFEGRKKVILIESASKMGNEAANSFLKTLEEPPDDTIFILLCVNPQELLPTIISRCQSIKFNRLSDTVVTNILKEKLSLSEEEAYRVTRLSNGSAKRALQFTCEEDEKIDDDVIEIIRASRLDNCIGMQKLAKKLSAYDKQVLGDVFDNLLIILRDMTVIKVNENNSILNKQLRKILKRIIESLSLRAIEHLYKTTLATKKAVWDNANRQLALEVLFFKIAEEMSIPYDRTNNE